MKRDDCGDLEAAAMPSADDYVLLAQIGEGGFGKVYKAKHKKIDRVVALKVIHPELISDATVMKRFEQEATSATNLTHSNLAAVYDHGRTADGAPFLVMDYLEGENLAQLLQEERVISCQRALEILIQIGDAVSHAHNKGVLHRDLKPSNIIISKDAGVECAKIIDFGIAKLMTAKRGDANRITQTAQVLGSPAYMSPEQCLGNKLDVRSDIYSFGCVMYEMLTGNPPFLGANPVQTVVKQINDRPVSFATDAGALMKRLEFVIFKCLDKNPDLRYQSMSELCLDLRRIRAGGAPRKRRRQAVSVPMSVLVSAAVICVIMLIVDQLQLPPQSRWIMSQPKAATGTPTGSAHTIEIKSIDNRVLYRANNVHSFKEAVAEAVSKKTNLSKANLSHCDLSTITGSNHVGIWFDGIDLSQAQFVGADLIDARFTGCNLQGANFVGANLCPRNYSVPGTIDSVLFSHCNLSQATFVGSQCLARIFSGSDLSGATFEGMHMNGCVFQNCNLSKASISGCEISSAAFAGSKLDRTSIINSMLSNSTFPKTKLNKVDFSGTDLSGVSFAGAKQTGLILKNAQNVPDD